jgi:hypothetical protein
MTPVSECTATIRYAPAYVVNTGQTHFLKESLDKRGLSSGSEQERVPLAVNCL